MALTQAKVEIIGRLGTDGELAQVKMSDTETQAVFNVSVAVDGYRGTVWWRGAAWGRTAMELSDIAFKKGDLVQMIGTPSGRAYQSNRDKKWYCSLECNIDVLQVVTVDVKPQPVPQNSEVAADG